MVLMLALTTRAAIQTKTVEYKQGDTTLEGVLVYDDAVKGKRPGVLIVHQWLGITEYEPEGKAAQEIRELWGWLARKVEKLVP